MQVVVSVPGESIESPGREEYLAGENNFKLS